MKTAGHIDLQTVYVHVYTLENNRHAIIAIAGYFLPPAGFEINPCINKEVRVICHIRLKSHPINSQEALKK